ncbi:MAG: aspartyl protease family protein [Pirellulales bacterium]
MKTVVSAWLVFVPLVALGADAPEIVLEKQGLKYGNAVWHLASDLSIAERVKTAERLERRLFDRRNQIDTLLEHNERMKAQLANLTEAQKAARAARNIVKGDSPEQKLLDEQIKQQGAAIDQLKKSIVPGEKLGATMPLKALVIDLVGIRSEAAFHVLTAWRHIQQAPARYEALRTNPEVVAALAALEPPGQLAPVRPYANEIRSLERIEKAIFTDELPLFREGKVWRVTGIANEELPLTFSLYESSEPTAITQSMADALGLDLAKQPKAERKLGKATMKVTTARLESLRFGRHLLNDVEVLVLPPESENLGARIGLAAFRGLRVRVVAERLLLRLEPKAEPEAK